MYIVLHKKEVLGRELTHPESGRSRENQMTRLPAPLASMGTAWLSVKGLPYLIGNLNDS